MATIDHKALARVAIRARLRLSYAPLRRLSARRSRFDKWSQFSDVERTRLISLAATVDRTALRRLAGLGPLLLVAFILTGSLLAFFVVIAVFSAAYALSFSPHTSPWLVELTTIAVLALIVFFQPLLFRLVLNAAVSRGMRAALMPQSGDAELIARVERKSIWSRMMFLVLILLFLFMAQNVDLSPSSLLGNWWYWLILLPYTAVFLHYALNVWRGPKSVDQRT